MKKKDGLLAIVMILAMLSWGGSWPVARLLKNNNPEVVIFWRFFITFVSLVPILIALKQPIKVTSKNGVIKILLGAVFLVVYNILFFRGVASGFAGEGGVFVTTLNPIFTFLFTALLFKQKLKGKESAGLILGLIGGMIIIGFGSLFGKGNVYFIFAAIAWAGLSVTSHEAASNMHAFVFSFYTYALAALTDFFLALPHGVFNVNVISFSAWLEILYLSVVATTFGTTVYFFASAKLGANKASSFTFIVPASALFFSWWIVNETPQPATIVGGIIALAAVYLINIKMKPKELKTVGQG